MVRFTMVIESLAELPLPAISAYISQTYQPVLAWLGAVLAELDLSDLAVAILIYLFEMTLRGRRAARPYRGRSRHKPPASERITPTLSSI